MSWIHKAIDTNEKLSVLSSASQYDLACACAKDKSERRQKSKDGKWIYPVTLPQGGITYLLKTLLSNQCRNDCKYCPFRVDQDLKRCSLEPDELAKTFFSYYRAKKVQGLFLSSAVIGTSDNTMQKINQVAKIIRRQGFHGYIHLKVIPGASEAAIRETIALSSAVSLNIEAPGIDNFKSLSKSKDYLRDVIAPIKLISRLTEKGSRYSHVKQTTQFVVGAAKETDQEIFHYAWKLYKKWNLNRVYFSGYQRGLGDKSIAGENSSLSNVDVLTREHRLYQVDWLVRKYGFLENEILFDQKGNLSLDFDPKEMWARNHPEYFPININKAGKYELLRVPGLGEVAVRQILQFRKNGAKIRKIEDLSSKPNKLLLKAVKYIIF